MLSVTKRGRVCRLEGKVLGIYLRLSLSTRDGAQAEKLKNLVQAAAREGNESENWPQLRRLLPEATFVRLTEIVGYAEKPAVPPPPTCTDLVRSFSAEAGQRIAIGKFRA